MFSHSFDFQFFQKKSCENYGHKKNTSTNISFSLSLVNIHFSIKWKAFKSLNYVFESSLFIFSKLEYYMRILCRCEYYNSYNNNNNHLLVISFWWNIAFKWEKKHLLHTRRTQVHKIMAQNTILRMANSEWRTLNGERYE